MLKMSGVRPPEGYKALPSGPDEADERPSGILSRLSNGVRALVTAIPVGGSNTPLDGDRFSLGITSRDEKVKQITKHLLPKGKEQ